MQPQVTAIRQDTSAAPRCHVRDPGFQTQLLSAVAQIVIALRSTGVSSAATYPSHRAGPQRLTLPLLRRYPGDRGAEGSRLTTRVQQDVDEVDRVLAGASFLGWSGEGPGFGHAARLSMVRRWFYLRLRDYVKTYFLPQSGRSCL
jgi:hypothetical protein